MRPANLGLLALLMFAGSSSATPIGSSSIEALPLGGDAVLAAVGKNPDWQIEGLTPGGELGHALCTAGDLNGDGFLDLVVGSPFASNGETLEGHVSIYYGSSTGPAESPDVVLEGNQVGALFGFSVAAAGDVNGDGFADLLVGATRYDNGELDEGRAFVFHGSPKGVATTPSWTAENDVAFSNFGFQVSTAGDVNGDGHADVVVGAPLADDAKGRAYTYLGSPTGLAPNPVWISNGDLSSANYGQSVAAAGDFDGDGLSDVAIGAPYYADTASGEGRVTIHRGSQSGVSVVPVFSAHGGSLFARLGTSVSTAGDVNGDGFADLISGASCYQDVGAAFVYHGSASATIGSPDWGIVGDQVNGFLGESVATAGDINGDGYAEVIVGAPKRDNGAQDAGYAALYMGSVDGLREMPSWEQYGDQMNAQYGSAVAPGGDVNGDGYGEFLIGARGMDGTGAAFGFFGVRSTPAISAGWTIVGGSVDGNLGRSVAAAGDVNGDGYPDLMIGSPGAAFSAGRLSVFYGSHQGFPDAPSWTLEGSQPDDGLAAQVSGAGDVNGDGYADVLVVEPGLIPPKGGLGRVSLFRGSSDGLARTASWFVEGNGELAVSGAGDVNGDGWADVLVGGSDSAWLYLGCPEGVETEPVWQRVGDGGFGGVLAAAGDVNADGLADFAVASPLASGGRGLVEVWLGAEAGPTEGPQWSFVGEAPADAFGFAVGAAGDVNDDGYTDVAVGSPLHDGNGPNAGRAYLFLGGEEGLGLSPAWTADGEASTALFGSSLVSGGDVDGDGRADLLVGASSDDSAATDAGAVYLYLGTESGLGSTFGWSVHGDQAGAELGAALAAADANGDGYSDVIAAAPKHDDSAIAGGRVTLYYGNGTPGVSLRPGQCRADADRSLAHHSATPYDAFGISVFGRSPFGRTRAKLQWEVTALGEVVPAASGVTTDWTDIGLPGGGAAGETLRENTPFLAEGVYRWRARLLYDASSAPWLAASRWVRMPWDGALESDLRVKIRPAILSIDDPTAFHVIHVKGEPAPNAVLRQVSNIGTAGLAWTTSTLPEVTWLTASPGQGSGLLASDPAVPVDLLTDPSTKVGVHETSLRFENTYDPSNRFDVPVKFEVLGPMFNPGDTLLGDFVTAEGDFTEARFDGLEGMTLKLVFPQTPMKMQTQVTLLDDLGDAVAEWVIKHGKSESPSTGFKPIKKKAKLTRSGTHTVRVTFIKGEAGPYEIKTARALPKNAEKYAQLKKGKGDPKIAQFKVLALPGATITAKFVPKGGFAGPLGLTVAHPDGGTLAVGTQSLANGGLSVDGFVADAAGLYLFTATGFGPNKEKVKGTLTPKQPKEGDQVVVLP